MTDDGSRGWPHIPAYVYADAGKQFRGLDPSSVIAVIAVIVGVPSRC